MSETMKPGPELDALIAEKVLGWALETNAAGASYFQHPQIEACWSWVSKFQPSTDLTTCAAAAEEARKAGKIRSWNLWAPDRQAGEFAASVWYEPSHPDRNFCDAVGESGAHALALALLKAVGA